MTPEQITTLKTLFKQHAEIESQIRGYGSQADTLRRVIFLESQRELVGLTGEQELELEYLQTEVLAGVQPYKKVSYPVGNIQPLKPPTQSEMYVRASRESMEYLDSIGFLQALPPGTHFERVPMQPPKRARRRFWPTIKAALKAWYADWRAYRARLKAYKNLKKTLTDKAKYQPATGSYDTKVNPTKE